MENIIEEFDQDKMTQIVSSLSKIPRLVGTEGEKKAIQFCKSLFKEIDIELQEEEFQCVRGWVGWIQQLLFVFGSALICLITIFIFINPILNLIIIGVLLLLFAIIAPRLTGTDGLPMIGKKFVTKNLYAIIPPKKLTEINNSNFTQEKQKQFIIISGHHDSKSQTLTTFFRGLGYVLLVTGLLPILIITLASIVMELLPNTETNQFMKFLTLIFAIISLAGTIMLASNRLGNNSPGSLDNASSIAVIYEIAKKIKINGGIENTSIIIALLGAEELGMWGARYFCKNHAQQFPPKQTVNINIDMIGLKNNPVSIMQYYGIPFKKPISPKLTQIIFKIAKDLKIPLDGFWMPIGASTDGFVFRSAGYEGCEFVVYNAAKKAHHKSDNITLWDSKIAAQNCKIIYELIQTLAIHGFTQE
ncbi:MAG: M28 family metallopeptidase [Promethearchaeota archaeon]